MKKNILLITISLLTFLYTANAQLTKLWVGGSSGDWNVGTNWDPVGVPGMNDEVEIDITATITNTGSTPQISRLFVYNGSGKIMTLNMNLNINGKGFGDEPAVQVNAAQLVFGSGFTFNIEGPTGREGILLNNSAGMLTNAGTVNITVVDDDGIRVNTGTLTNNNSITVDGGANDQRLMILNTGGTLSNAGTLNLTGGKQFSRVQVNPGGAITNEQGATFDINDGRLTVVGASVGFTNNGLFTADINGPLRTDAAPNTSTVNNGFYDYKGNIRDFSTDSGSNITGTNNGIDLNDASQTTIDAANSCTVDIAEEDYEWFDGATSVGTATSAGSLTLGAGTLSSSPASITTSEYGGTVTITIENPCSAALPVELLYFRAKEKETDIDLFWATASETNNEGFSIERSTNGRDFEEIAWMDGAGTIFEQLRYEFTDVDPVNGLNYYRLKQIDFDGAFEYSKTVSVDFGGKAVTGRLSLFPTVLEAGQELKIDLSDYEEGNVTFEIFNIAGQLVKSLSSETGNIISLNTSNLGDGMYLIRTSGLRTNETGKFFISNK